MNIYQVLNEITTYIEEHLEEKIDYEVLAKMMGVNVYTLQRIFSLITNVSLAEYIRKRRLSCAAFDLYNSKTKIIDLAIKYQYDNATSFSRAFTLFHGVKPSQVKKGEQRFKNFSKLCFDETIGVDTEEMSYHIKQLDAFTLYGMKKKTDDDHISYDAPAFWEEMDKKYKNKYGEIAFGMVSYEERFESTEFEYWVLWNKEIPEFEKVEIPKSKWLIFPIHSRKAEEIQKVSSDFYIKFLPSSKYNLRDIPELEYYHDGETDFLVPIE